WRTAGPHVAARWPTARTASSPRPGAPPSLLLHRVAAELVAERRQHAIGERVGLPRAEAAEERQRQHRRGHAALDGLLHRPASLARVVDPAADLLEPRILNERALGQLEQPGAHHAAAIPERGDLGEVVSVFARLQDLEALGVGLHEAVFDSIV